MLVVAYSVGWIANFDLVKDRAESFVTSHSKVIYADGADALAYAYGKASPVVSEAYDKAGFVVDGVIVSALGWRR